MPDDRQEIKVFLNFVPVCKTAEAPDPLIPSEVEGRAELPARSLDFARDKRFHRARSRSGLAAIANGRTAYRIFIFGTVEER
jgi:hypothetical protein